MIGDDNSPLAEILQAEAVTRARKITSASDLDLSKMKGQISKNVLDRMIRGLMALSASMEHRELALQAAERLANFRELSADNVIYKNAN